MYSFKGAGADVSAERVEISLVHQGEGNAILVLEGEDAKKARESVGGTWVSGSRVNVFFDREENVCGVERRDPTHFF